MHRLETFVETRQELAYERLAVCDRRTLIAFRMNDLPIRPRSGKENGRSPGGDEDTLHAQALTLRTLLPRFEPAFVPVNAPPRRVHARMHVPDRARRRQAIDRVTFFAHAREGKKQRGGGEKALHFRSVTRRQICQCSLESSCSQPSIAGSSLVSRALRRCACHHCQPWLSTPVGIFDRAISRLPGA